MADLSNNGGLDVSIPLQAGKGVQQTNPLESIGRFANTQNALNQAKLFPGQLQLQQQAVQGGATALAEQQYRAAARALVPLLAKKLGTITVDDVATAAGSAEKHLGIITQPFIQALTDGAPPGGDYDPFVRSMITAQSQVSPEAAVGQVSNHQGPLASNGSTLIPTIVPGAGLPNAGLVTQVPGAGIGLGLTPSEQATQVPRTATAADVAANPSLTVGQPITENLRTRLNSQGAGDLVTPGAAPVPGLPPSLRNPARQQPPPIAPVGAPGAATTAPAGPIATGLSPAQAAAQSETGATSAKAFQDISDQSVKAKAQDAVLANMQADAAQFVTGPGADSIKHFKSVVVRIGDALGTSFGIDKDKLAANVSFDKLANQIADAQGAGSDARLAVNQAANPSAQLTPEGVDLVLRQLRGNTDYQQARAQLAAAYPDKADRPGFEAKIGTNLDPRVFQYSRLTPEQRGSYFKGLTDKAAFKKAYVWAEQHQLIGGPNAGQ